MNTRVATEIPIIPFHAQTTRALYRQYAALGQARNDVTFVGRLGTYKYYNMDRSCRSGTGDAPPLAKRHETTKALADA